jgi:hypothetical protein
VGLVAILVDKVIDFVKENGRGHSKVSVCLEESRKSGSYSVEVDPASDNDKQDSPVLRCVDHDPVVFCGVFYDASVSLFLLLLLLSPPPPPPPPPLPPPPTTTASPCHSPPFFLSSYSSSSSIARVSK